MLEGIYLVIVGVDVVLLATDVMTMGVYRRVATGYVQYELFVGIAWVVVVVINEVRLGINVILESIVVVPVGTASVTTIKEKQ